jgi:hypothetical protein
MRDAAAGSKSDRADYVRLLSRGQWTESTGGVSAPARIPSVSTIMIDGALVPTRIPRWEVFGPHRPLQ